MLPFGSTYHSPRALAGCLSVLSCLLPVRWKWCGTIAAELEADVLWRKSFPFIGRTSRRLLGTSTLHWARSLHVIIWAGVHSFPRFCFRYYFVFYFAIKFTSIYMKFYGSFNFFCIKLHHLLKAPPLPSAACLVIWQMRPGTGTGNWWNWAQNGSRI